MKNTFRNLFYETENLISQLNEDDYKLSLSVLSKNSVGKHVRHILDLFECLIESSETGILNYDNRRRCAETEINKKFALQKLNFIREKIDDLNLKKELLFSQKIGHNDIECLTTVERELLYNIEHCVHHLAIIKIGIEQNFPYIKIPEDFGVAYSTIQNREKTEA